MMEYRIIHDCRNGDLPSNSWIMDRYEVTFSSLEDNVNFLISIGWKPLGGVSSIGTANRAYLTQAMILEDDHEQD